MTPEERARQFWELHADGFDYFSLEEITQAITEAVAEEREAIAKSMDILGEDRLAAAIRNRDK